MSRPVNEIIDEMLASGLSQRQLALMVELSSAMLTPRPRSTGAERTAKWRAKRHGDASHVTSQVTSHVTSLRHNDIYESTSLTSLPKEEKKEKKKKHTCAIALPTTWKLDEQDREYARAKGWDQDRIAAESERFRNHAEAKGRKQTDWRAAWRNWVTSPYQHKANGNAKTQGSLAAAADDLIREARELERGTCARDDLFRGDGDGQVIDGTVAKSKTG